MCTSQPESTSMEIALKLIVIDFDALCSTFTYRRISGDTGAMIWTTFVAILLGIYCDKRYRVLIAFSELAA